MVSPHAKVFLNRKFRTENFFDEWMQFENESYRFRIKEQFQWFIFLMKISWKFLKLYRWRTMSFKILDSECFLWRFFKKYRRTRNKILNDPWNLLLWVLKILAKKNKRNSIKTFSFSYLVTRVVSFGTIIIITYNHNIA